MAGNIDDDSLRDDMEDFFGAASFISHKLMNMFAAMEGMGISGASDDRLERLAYEHGFYVAHDLNDLDDYYDEDEYS